MELLIGALFLAAAWTVFFDIIGWLEGQDWKSFFQLFVAPVGLGLFASRIFPSEAHPVGWPIACAVGALVVWIGVWEEWTRRPRLKVLSVERKPVAEALGVVERPKRYTDTELKAAIDKTVNKHKTWKPAPPNSLFATGELVFHLKFGNGHVTAVDGNKLTIQFDTVGVRRVVDSFVERA